MGTIPEAPGAGLEPALGRLTGACVAASPPWYLSLSTDSNGPLPGTGRVRRRLRLRGSARRSSHQTTGDLQTCDARSASALFSRDEFGRRYLVFGRGLSARGRPHLPKLQGSESNRCWSRGRESNSRIHRVAAGGLTVLAT